MPNPRYDFRGPEEGALQYVKRHVPAGWMEDITRTFFINARSMPGSTIVMGTGRGHKDIAIVAVSTKDGMRYEITLQ